MERVITTVAIYALGLSLAAWVSYEVATSVSAAMQNAATSLQLSR